MLADIICRRTGCGGKPDVVATPFRIGCAYDVELSAFSFDEFLARKLGVFVRFTFQQALDVGGVAGCNDIDWGIAFGEYFAVHFYSFVGIHLAIAIFGHQIPVG